MIAAHSLSIACYSPSPQSLPFYQHHHQGLLLTSNFFFFFFFKFLAYLCIKYMIVGHHKTFLKVVQKGFHYLVYESPSKLLKKDGTFQSNIIGLLFKYCCSKGLSTHAADTVNFQGMIYNLLVNLSNICKIFRITKSILLPTIMYNILSFKIVKHSSLCLLSINKKVRTYLIMRHP